MALIEMASAKMAQRIWRRGESGEASETVSARETPSDGNIGIARRISA